ncbi:hypothetical protein CISIN_1g0237902mg, partial [Citrus sinensis]
TISL